MLKFNLCDRALFVTKGLRKEADVLSSAAIITQQQPYENTLICSGQN